MTTTSYTVSGMTCGHCVSAVSEEIGKLEGVTDVGVELVPAGDSRVRVTSSDPLPEPEVRTAVEEAGYTLTGTAG